MNFLLGRSEKPLTTEDETGRTKAQANRNGIFISYRRSDSKPWTARLAENLRTYFTHDRVYLDLDSTRPGQDYVNQIRLALRASRLVVAVIGPNWLNATSAGTGRGLDDPTDLVRRELETALHEGIALLVVLVGGASIPPANKLPPSLRTLAQVQAMRMEDEDWDYDLGRMIEVFEGYGLYPTCREGEPVPPWQAQAEQALIGPRRYERSFQASRRRALDGVTGAVEALKYKERRVMADAAKVTFTVFGRSVTVSVVDAGAGRSTVVVELRSPKTTALAFGTGILGVATGGLGLAAWPVLRAWEHNFAKGFLDNVAGVLEGRGVVEDSALPPKFSTWLRRNRSV